MSRYSHFRSSSSLAGGDFISSGLGFMSLFSNSVSGISVTPLKAMQHTAVFSCIRVLSETMGTLPISVYKKEVKNGKTINKKAHDHPLNKILKKPNPNQTKMGFFEMATALINLYGEFVAQVVRNKKNEILQLVPLDINKLTKYLSESGEIFYTYNSDKYGEVFLDRTDVLRVVGLTLDGYNGLSAIEYNRHSLGLSMALEEYGGNFFKNGANSSGAFKTPNVLSDTAYQRLKEDLKKKYAGLKNSGKFMLLEEGLDFVKFTIPNNDSQFLESRKFQKSEIAGMFRVPPHMIGDLEKATFSNIEQQSLDFGRYSILPWVTRFEEALNDILLDNDENFYVKFNMDVIQRADMKTRYEGYGKAIKDGWLSRNEVRELEDKNPVDGLDEYLYPLNMAKEGEDEKSKEK